MAFRIGGPLVGPMFPPPSDLTDETIPGWKCNRQGHEAIMIGTLTGATTEGRWGYCMTCDEVLPVSLKQE